MTEKPAEGAQAQRTMTPDERAQTVAIWVSQGGTLTTAVASQIRAALAARDREWREAVALLRIAHKDITEGGDDCLWAFGSENPGGDPPNKRNECIAACRCRALRALLSPPSAEETP